MQADTTITWIESSIGLINANRIRTLKRINQKKVSYTGTGMVMRAVLDDGSEIMAYPEPDQIWPCHSFPAPPGRYIAIECYLVDDQLDTTAQAVLAFEGQVGGELKPAVVHPGAFGFNDIIVHDTETGKCWLCGRDSLYLQTPREALADMLEILTARRAKAAA